MKRKKLRVIKLYKEGVWQLFTHYYRFRKILIYHGDTIDYIQINVMLLLIWSYEKYGDYITVQHGRLIHNRKSNLVISEVLRLHYCTTW